MWLVDSNWQFIHARVGDVVRILTDKVFMIGKNSPIMVCVLISSHEL